MSGTFHECAVQLIRDEPALVPWLLRRAGEPVGARCVGVQAVRAWADDSGPTGSRAGDAFRLEFADGSRRVVVCEVVGEWSEDRLHRLPRYVAEAFEEYRVPVVLLAVCRKDALARRLRRGIDVGPGSSFAVAAVGPGDMPDLGSDDIPPSAAAAVMAAAMRRQPKRVPVELFVSALARWLGTVEPGRAARYTSLLIALLAKESASLLELVTAAEARRFQPSKR